MSTSAVSRQRHRRRVWLAWGLCMLALVSGFGLWLVNGVIRGVPGPVVAGVYVTGAVDVVVVVVMVLSTAILATLASVMMSRVPDNRIGRIFCWLSVWMAATFFVTMSLYFLHSPTSAETAFANWLGAWSFVLFVPTSLVLMIFPDGKLLSPRWRVLPWMAIGGTLGWAMTEAFGARLGLEDELPNAYANETWERIGGLVVVLLLPALVGTVVSLFVRYRSATQEVRAQIRWVAVGASLQVLVNLALWLIEAIGTEGYPIGAVLVGTISTLLVPITLSVAILKYRLYEIGHLVSRTVSYAVLAGLLGAIFVGGVLAVQTFLDVSSNLAVAATTLAVAAIFNPLRRRLHAVMDRRFNRRRVDAARLLEDFAARLGSVTTVADLSGDISRTVEATFAPQSFGMWIRYGKPDAAGD